MKELTKAKFGALMAKLSIPDGFTGRMTTEPKWGNTGGWLVYKVENEKVRIEFSQHGDGSTNFIMADGKWHTFDARGVSASFYFLTWDGKMEGDLNEIVKEQLEKIEQALAYEKTAVKVPGLRDHSVSPDELVEMKRKIKAGKQVTFMPHGFGTSYSFGTKRTRWARLATPEQAAFFGVTTLFVETNECD